MKATLIAALVCATLPSPAGSQGKPLPQPPNLKAELARSDISQGVAKIRSRIEGCAAKTQAQGTVMVAVKVVGSGMVDSVRVVESPTPALGACVAAAMQNATFARTQKGGTFSYPFKF